MSSNRIFDEIEEFLALQIQLSTRGFTIREIDEYGFVVGSLGSVATSRIDLLVTGLVHGDEVIGVEAINQVLHEILEKKICFPINVGFLLCNVDAARSGVRFLETDLNRSFLVETASTLEQRRAVQIVEVIKETSVVFDIHQTVEPTESPFFVFEHKLDLIRIANQLLPEIPIVTFSPGGFSDSGKTMIEYASSVNVLGLAVECGQCGFSEELSQKTAGLIFKLIEELARGVESDTRGKKIQVHQLSVSIQQSGDAHLVPGLTNYMSIHAGQVLGYDGNSPLLAPFDGHLFFPRYGELARTSPELCNLGKTVWV